jgi:hypothetical protein
MTGLDHRFDENVYDLNAILHPGSVFDHPKDVLADRSLSRTEKRAILASWASDAAAVASHPELRAMPGKDAGFNRRDSGSAVQSRPLPQNAARRQAGPG